MNPMKAIAYLDPHLLTASKLEVFEVPRPVVGARDLLVDIRAVSVNPVDTKIRRSRGGQLPDRPVILGWDAVGIVIEMGPDVRGFALGDRVYYAGDIMRPGSNAELQAVDHRIVAHAPTSLDDAQAAALPLTALTAWEALFEKLVVSRSEASDILVVGGAGGVGSIAVQLLKALTPARVHATAGRPESRAWLERLGVHRVVERAGLLGDESAYDAIFSTTASGEHWAKYARVLRPFGSVCLIDDPGPIDIGAFKMKALSIHWELMFTKARFDWHADSQGEILRQVAALVDNGTLQTTAGTVLHGLTVANVREAHAVLEAGTAVGKIVITRGGEGSL